MVVHLIGRRPTTVLPWWWQSSRGFINARVKWVRDPYLDHVVSREKNLVPILSLKSLIVTSPTKTLPFSSTSPLNLRYSFFPKYPTLFLLFRPCPFSLPRIKLTQKAIALHNEEVGVHNEDRDKSVERLARVLMLAGGNKLPFKVIDLLRFDLGLPVNYVPATLSYYPDWFQVCSVEVGGGSEELGLELVSWRDDLALSVMERRVAEDGGVRKGMRLRFPMQLPNGFDFEKRVQNWVEEWQNLPYISPYENAFHLGEYGDQAEKWMVAVLHELMHLFVSKKTEIGNLVSWGEWLGFGALRLRRALKHHPGIFYISNKIKTQTVVLRESYRKDFLVDKHPLMGIRYRYIHLISKSLKRRRKQGEVVVLGQKQKVSKTGGNDTGIISVEEKVVNTTYDSESEDASDDEMPTGALDYETE